MTDHGHDSFYDPDLDDDRLVIKHTCGSDPEGYCAGCAHEEGL